MSDPEFDAYVKYTAPTDKKPGKIEYIDASGNDWVPAKVPYGQNQSYTLGSAYENNIDSSGGAKGDDFKFQGINFWAKKKLDEDTYVTASKMVRSFGKVSNGTVYFNLKSHGQGGQGRQAFVKKVDVNSGAGRHKGYASFVVYNKNDSGSDGAIGVQLTIKDNTGIKATNNNLYTSQDPDIPVEKDSTGELS